MRTEPLSPIPVVTRVHEETTDTYIKVYYPNIYTDEQTGGSPTISLNLWYDQGADNWITVNGETPWFSMSEYFTVGLPVGLLTPGQDYKFKYRAINIFGEGAFSEVSTVKAAMRPD